MTEPMLHQKVRVYAKSAALTAEVSALALKEGEQSAPSGITLNLDVAKKIDSGFDWPNKITLQLSPLELPEFEALLLGYIDSLKFQRPDKGIELLRQDKSLFLKASKKGAALCAMPIPTASIFQLSVLVLELLKKQNNTTDVNVIIASLRMFAKK